MMQEALVFALLPYFSQDEIFGGVSSKLGKMEPIMEHFLISIH